MDRPLKVNVGTREKPELVDDDEAMELVQMAQVCRAYRVLPRAGGLLDQDALFVYILAAYDKAVREREAREAAKVKK